MESFAINRVNAFTPQQMPERKDPEREDNQQRKDPKNEAPEAKSAEGGEKTLPDDLGSNIDIEA